MTEINQSVFEKYFLRRDDNAHKGDFGRGLFICGSYGMAGAAVMSISAALRSGIGLCEGFVPECIYQIVASSVPEAVFTPVKANMFGRFSDESVKILEERLETADAVLCGCGMGVDGDTQTLTETCICKCKVPLVIDADGLNALSKHIDLLEKHQGDIILTPHPGEMARLTGESVDEINSRRSISASQLASKYGVYVVLKGHRTVVAFPDGGVCENPTGNPGMAAGGSGDVLAGIMTSLLAQGIKTIDAVRAAVYIHGLAGDLAAMRMSQRSMLPTDIIKYLPQLFLRFEK